jgi:hypothetical protein
MAFGELMHEPRARFTVRRMMGAVALLSLGIAGLRSPSRGFASAIFTLTTLILLISIICVAYHKGPRRYFWRGFAVFGCGHQFVAFWTATGSGNPPLLLTSALFDVARDLLRDGATVAWAHVIDFVSVSPHAGIRYWASWEIFHSLATLLIAYFAGICACRLFESRDGREDDRAATEQQVAGENSQGLPTA